MPKPELVYGTTSCSNSFYGMGERSLVILPRKVAEKLAVQRKALGCTTWGEIRRTCPRDVYRELLELADLSVYEDEELSADGIPRDDTRFVEPGAVDDGDWPPARFLLMRSLLPNSIIVKFGNSYTTTFSGDFVEFDAEQKTEIIAELDRLGFKCVEDQELIDAAGP